MIYLVIGWFKMMKYDDKHVMSITSLVGTMWLAIYPSPTVINSDQGS